MVVVLFFAQVVGAAAAELCVVVQQQDDPLGCFPGDVHYESSFQRSLLGIAVLRFCVANCSKSKGNSILLIYNDDKGAEISKPFSLRGSWNDPLGDSFLREGNVLPGPDPRSPKG